MPLWPIGCSQSVLFNFYIFVNFPLFLLLVTSSFCSLHLKDYSTGLKILILFLLLCSVMKMCCNFYPCFSLDSLDRCFPSLNFLDVVWFIFGFVHFVYEMPKCSSISGFLKIIILLGILWTSGCVASCYLFLKIRFIGT